MASNQFFLFDGFCQDMAPGERYTDVTESLREDGLLCACTTPTSVCVVFISLKVENNCVIASTSNPEAGSVFSRSAFRAIKNAQFQHCRDRISCMSVDASC